MRNSGTWRNELKKIESSLGWSRKLSKTTGRWDIISLLFNKNDEGTNLSCQAPWQRFLLDPFGMIWSPVLVSRHSVSVPVYTVAYPSLHVLQSLGARPNLQVFESFYQITPQTCTEKIYQITRNQSHMKKNHYVMHQPCFTSSSSKRGNGQEFASVCCYVLLSFSWIEKCYLTFA